MKLVCHQRTCPPLGNDRMLAPRAAGSCGWAASPRASGIVGRPGIGIGAGAGRRRRPPVRAEGVQAFAVVAATVASAATAVVDGQKRHEARRDGKTFVEVEQQTLAELQHGSSRCVVDTRRHVVELWSEQKGLAGVIHLQELQGFPEAEGLQTRVRAGADSLWVEWVDGGAIAASLAVQKGSSTQKVSSYWARERGERSTGDSWDGGWLDAGFVLDWSVRKDCATLAEMNVSLGDAHWYGGGHLMAQFWPLERAMIEVGPFLPFDNGPNGINTQVHPAWINSQGLAVVAAEDTPYFHVGLNAPGRIENREWAVGVQNAFQPVLPHRDDGSGDGLLRLQRRTSYWDPQMRHPLAQFGGGPVERILRHQIASEEDIERIASDTARIVSEVPMIQEVLGGASSSSVGKPTKAQVFAQVRELLEQKAREGLSDVNNIADEVEQGVRNAYSALEELLDLAIFRIPAPLQPFNSGQDELEVVSRIIKQRLQMALRSTLPARPSDKAPWERMEDQTPDGYLNLRVCVAAYPHVKAAAQALLSTVPKAHTTPPLELWEQPIWTTWARFKAAVHQRLCLQFAEEIIEHDMPRGVMEIDDQWQEYYGDTHFHPTKFPDAAGMVKQLHDWGFKVTVWVMPFFQEASQAFKEARSNGYLIRREAAVTSEPAMVQTWLEPKVAVLDVTNPAAVDWYVGRLKALQASVGVDGFKFDAGEPCFLPFGCHTYRPLRHPAEFTHLYITRIAKEFPFGEVRSSFLTQQVPMFTRMGDKFSSFSVNNGLGSLIPTLLTSGILGYPFVLPDMVGGNAYFLDMPSKELVVRWTQANALMPAIQFSIAPWDLRGGAWWLAKLIDSLLHPFRDDAAEAAETTACVQQALGLRQRFHEHLLRLVDRAAETAEPICRPLWWSSPEDSATFTIDDEFMLGERVLVAPQVLEGRGARDVYLPEGRWRRINGKPVALDDEVSGDCDDAVSGPTWLRAVQTDIEDLPIYEKVG